MVLHECQDCGKVFNKKSLFIEHRNRKNKCNEKMYTLNCIYCNRSFSTKSSVTRHIQNSCIQENETR
jgi:uncharacterized C2H2 Zn-finger protein